MQSSVVSVAQPVFNPASSIAAGIIFWKHLSLLPIVFVFLFLHGFCLQASGKRINEKVKIKVAGIRLFFICCQFP
jgi:hypothetical protein